MSKADKKSRTQANRMESAADRSKPATYQMPAEKMSKEGRDGEMPSESIESSAEPVSTAGAMEFGAGERGMPGGNMVGGYGTAGERGRAGASGMPSGDMSNSDSDGDSPDEGSGNGLERVLIELRIPASQAASDGVRMAARMNLPGFQVDTSYEAVPMAPAHDQAAKSAAAGEQTIVIRGTIETDKIPQLEAQPNVVKVWKDTPIAPFGAMLLEEEQTPRVVPMEGFAACPIGTCDCSPGTAKGTIADVANYLGVDQIWAAGNRGDGMVVGVVDGGITAQGRSIDSADTGNPGWPGKLIPRVIGGWPTADWGTTGVGWNWHGNMCSTDVLGMAPNAQIFDIRISAGGIAATISAALAGFQWAIDQHRSNGTPQILTNSWGIFQKVWDEVYATDPNHLFTRKVVEALDEGILVLFAAGNCGGTCPDGRCGPDSGPGKSIWGANGHPRVMTVGAVNKNEQFVGYSSQGPAALDPNKPDFCSITHFQGFFGSDSGTSAATPIAAGVVALLKQANPSLSQDQAKSVLKDTAKDIGPAGFDQHSGAGIIRPLLAHSQVARAPAASGPVVAWGSNRLDVFVVGTNRALFHKWWNGSAWGPSLTGYEAQGGVIMSNTEVASWGPNRLDVFVVGTDRALYHKWWNGAAWGPSLTGYERQGGIIVSRPRVVSWGPNRLDAFVVGTDSALYHKWWNGSAWGPSLTGYERQGGVIVGDPEAVSWGANRLDVFVLGTDSAVYHKWWNGSAWGPSLTGYEHMGGVCMTAPKAVCWGPNRIDLFVVGTDSALYHKAWNGAAWGPSLTGWNSLGGVCASEPVVVSWGSNRLDIFVLGTDQAVYHKWWNGSSWGPSATGWERMGGVCMSPPRAVCWGPNRIDLFVTGTDRALYHKWWNGSAWGPSLTGWERQGGVISDF